jgi:murein peptide amidase A
VTGLARSRRLPPGHIRGLAAFACVFACGAFGALVDLASAGERTAIGHSVGSRAITATLKGDPAAPARALVIGCVHGNEPAGIRVARRLIAGAPARNAAIRVVPSLNPDGVAAKTRGNARGVASGPTSRSGSTSRSTSSIARVATRWSSGASRS